MVMKAAHRAGSLPFCFGVLVYTDAPIPIRIGTAGLCYAVSTINDWDHPNYQRRWHPGAMAVRWTARVGYGYFRTAQDVWRLDLHRGPSHSIEWCALVGLLVTWVTAGAPPLIAGTWSPLAPYCWYFGLAAFLGTGSHVLLDWMTPSGVPLCATWNYFRYGEVWRRHACAWYVPLYEVSYFLRWIRWPRPILVDESEPGCKAGLFHTNEGGEHLVVVPSLYALTGVAVLAYLGVLGPLLTMATGWGGAS